MRLISFSTTVPQFRDRTKTVTRRLGWANLKPGDLLGVIPKSTRALRNGEQPEVLGVIRVVSVRREPLSAITRDEVDREGFPHMSIAEFVSLFIKVNGMTTRASTTEVARIEFEYVTSPLEDEATPS
jgi:hypothetical protein